MSEHSTHGRGHYQQKNLLNVEKREANQQWHAMWAMRERTRAIGLHRRLYRNGGSRQGSIYSRIWSVRASVRPGGGGSRWPRASWAPRRRPRWAGSRCAPFSASCGTPACNKWRGTCKKSTHSFSYPRVWNHGSCFVWICLFLHLISSADKNQIPFLALWRRKTFLELPNLPRFGNKLECNYAGITDFEIPHN